MSQHKSKSNSTLLQAYSGSIKGCGCLLLVLIGLYGASFILFVEPLFFSFGIKDKQVEILVGSFGTSWLTKVKQSEGKQYVGSMNRGQQAYYAENNVFATSIDALGIGIKTETDNYKYSLRVTKTAAFNYAISNNKTIKDYVAAVFLVPAKESYLNADRDEMTTLTIICQSEKRPFFRFKQTDEPGEPIYQNGNIICGKGTTEVTK
ncbi:MAG: general secretion pathway protein GspH [Microcoleus sp. SU_5_3]|nr:general secretion pathway protein GspH [Microcoleus sp. SU_5_3]